jgi:ligand-binding sensor domain-containing protein
MFSGFFLRFTVLLFLLCNIKTVSAQWAHFNQANTGEGINNATCIKADNSGIVWIGTSNNGLYQYDKSLLTWTRFYSPDTAGFPYNNISSIYISGSKLYVTTPFLGLGVYSSSLWSTISTTTTSNGLPDNETYGTAIDSKGNLWVVTYTGLGKDSTNGTWYKYQNATTPSLPTDNLYSIFIDNLDAKWLGTHGSGLVKFKGGAWQVYTMSNSGIPSNTVNRVKKSPDGNYWVATDNGLAKFDGGSTWTVYDQSNTSGGLPGNIINDITIDTHGNIFAATNGGLGVLMKTGNVWYTYTTPDLPENNLTGVSLNPQTEEIWISTFSTGIASLAHSALALDDHDSGFNEEHSFSIYPNPASEQSYITYKLFGREKVNLTITDLSGKGIMEVLNDNQGEGLYSVNTNLMDLASGMYMVRLRIGDRTGVKRLLVVK